MILFQLLSNIHDYYYDKGISSIWGLASLENSTSSWSSGRVPICSPLTSPTCCTTYTSATPFLQHILIPYCSEWWDTHHSCSCLIQDTGWVLTETSCPKTLLYHLAQKEMCVQTRTVKMNFSVDFIETHLNHVERNNNVYAWRYIQFDWYITQQLYFPFWEWKFIVDFTVNVNCITTYLCVVITHGGYSRACCKTLGWSGKMHRGYSHRLSLRMFRLMTQQPLHIIIFLQYHPNIYFSSFHEVNLCMLVIFATPGYIFFILRVGWDLVSSYFGCKWAHYSNPKW